MTADAPTESVAVSGNTATPAFEGMFDPTGFRIDPRKVLADNAGLEVRMRR